MNQASVLPSELTRVVALREGIKRVVGSAFEINLLGLNAILLAAQFGERAKGFGVISNELRAFSKVLREQMLGVSEQSHHLVDLATRQLKLKRQMTLLAEAGAPGAEHPGLSAAVTRQKAEYADLDEAIAKARKSIIALVDAAYQACLFGTVIARSARIEAAHAGDSGRSLSSISDAFSESVRLILPGLEVLKRFTGGGL